MRQLIFFLVMAFSTFLNAAEITNIAAAPEQVSPLLPGMNAPTLQLKDKSGKTIDLATRYQENISVLVVYRGGWCPYCSRQLAGIQEIEPQLIKMGAQIIAIAPDSPEALAKSTIESPHYQLLSDNEMRMSQALGLAYYLDDKTALAYRNKLGVNFVDLDGKDKVALPVPAVFVVDKKGLIQFQYANPNYKVRLDENVLLAAVKAASQR
ncbi:peroxiredoxin-like family protein [Pseudoalteromonas piscicida]|uniref:thioredoxin-dependent peroxiredoxin n=1 Tax=Pseudoalteromonas piscicida TaxID=43662 RepID=A0A2A5JQA6_PSEO7|nr:peroxiredoxin-like family protein [Pseudoalteromonas piscicida]PCK31654.1 alkyl hydroperoxide reductase [Pseudoalteromonas piscicida]